MAAFPLKDPENLDLTGGDLLAQSLKNVGVEVAFGLHGGHLDSFLVGCEFAGIRLIDTRHETVAVQAAEAYAKFKAKIGVCFITANSGFSNGIPGLATALADRSPILCITSSPPLRDAENNSLQGIVDQVVTSRSLTKFSHRVTNQEDIPRILSLAIRTALAGPPGPVLLDIPIDVLFSPVHRQLISWGSISSPLPFAPGANTEAVKATIELIGSSKRPVIIVGSGGNSKEAGKQIMKFSSTCGIPVFDTQKCTMFSVPANFPLYAGSASLLALLPTLGKQQPDLVILLGARTGMYLGGQSGVIIPQQSCKLLQVDVDGGEIGRTLPVDLGITSDVGQFATALNNQPDAEAFKKSIDPGWANDVLSLKLVPSSFETTPDVQPSGRLHPYHALKSVFSSIEPGSIIILDGGDAALWASDVVSLCSPSALIKSTGYLGFLGNGFGYALGSAVAAPDRKVVSIHGDGSAGFHFMNLDTYKRFDLNIMTIVVNNHCWGMSLNGQDMVYNTKNPARPVSKLHPATEYENAANALGCTSAKLDSIAPIPQTVKKLQAHQGPSCINLVVDAKPAHPVTSALVGYTDDPGTVVVPYYANVPRTYYQS